MTDLPTPTYFCQAVIPISRGPLPAWVVLLGAIVLLVAAVIGFNAIRALLSLGMRRAAWGRLIGFVRKSPLRAVVFIALTVAASGLMYWALRPIDEVAREGSSAATDGQWTMFHADTARTGRADSSTPPASPKLAWKFHDSLILERLPFACSPAIAGQRVLIGGDAQKLYCLNLDNGTPLWIFEAKAGIFCSPAVWNDRVYVGEGLHQNRDCKLYCLDLRDGTVLWSVSTTSHTESSPTVHEGRVYFGAGDDGVYCVDALTGREIWHLRKGHVDGSPLVVGGRVYVGSGYDFKGLLCLDATKGEILWSKDLPAACWGGPSWSDGRLYLAIGNGNFSQSDEQPLGMVLCLDPKAGDELWRFTEAEDAILTSVAIASGRAIFGSRDGSCYAVDAETGKRAWEAKIGSPILSSPAVAGDRVIFGADDGLLYCLSVEDGRQLWSYDTSPDVLAFSDSDSRVQSSPAIGQGRIVFGAANGNVYCLGEPSGSQPIVSQTRFKSRLMRAADAALTWLLHILGDRTGSYGVAILLIALATRLILLPADWMRVRHLSKAQAMSAPSGDSYRPASVAYSMIQGGALVVLVLVLAATPLVAGKSFLWIADLSLPDRLGPAMRPQWPGVRLCPLPILLGWLSGCSYIPGQCRRAGLVTVCTRSSHS